MNPDMNSDIETDKPVTISGDRAKGGWRRPLRLLDRALIVLSVLLLAIWIIAIFGSRLYQDYTAQRLLARPATGRSDPAPGVGRFPPEEGTPLGRIEIPRIGLSALVVEGWSSRSFLAGAGHLAGSPLPGQPGNVILAGHRDTVFRPLKDVRLNDLIEVETPARSYLYRVTSIGVDTERRLALPSGPDAPDLTLITCYPFHYIGSAPWRFVVGAQSCAGTS